jgi:trimeric autotransporter adhesin
MNSFKKIALAVVAAMTLGTVAVAPANATVMTVAVSLNSVANTTNGVIATPAVLPVPEDNTIDATDALRFVATVAAGTSVTAVATNATIVSALHTPAAPVGASSGSSSLTVATGTGNTATFFVYTKTTAIGTVVINNGGTTLTYYVQGTAGKINNLTVAAPTAGAAGTKQDIVVTATDAFGNKVSGKSITATVFASTAVMDTATVTTGATLADFGTATFKATLPTTGTRSLITFAPTTAGDAVSGAVVGLTAPSLAPFAEIAVRDLVSELAAQTAAKDAALAAVAKATADALAAKVASDAALAAEKAASTKALADAKVASDAALAAAVKVETDKAAAAKAASDAALLAKDATIAKLTADNAAALASLKKSFNALATKWNKKNPKAKVTLVK